MLHTDGLKNGNISSATSAAFTQPLFTAKSLVCFHEATRLKKTSSDFSTTFDGGEKRLSNIVDDGTVCELSLTTGCF